MPPELIAPEDRLDDAEQAARAAFVAIMPPGVPPGQRVVVHQPTDEEIQRWLEARDVRDELRAQHRAMIDRLFEA